MTNQRDALMKAKEAFEKRDLPRLNLKKDGDGEYVYEAASSAWMDFLDGYRAALAEPQPSQSDDLTPLKALQMLWPFIAEERTQLVSKSYGEAIFNAAKVMGKKCTLEMRNHGTVFVVELEE